MPIPEHATRSATCTIIESFAGLPQGEPASSNNTLGCRPAFGR
jgi:hypothetical protein